MKKQQEYIGFGSWDSLTNHISSGMNVWYQAPMDFRPAKVACIVRKSDKIVRVLPLNSDAESFWADKDHLDRFKMEAPL